MFYQFTRQQLKNKKASSFKEGDCIKVGGYYILIKYGPYKTPDLCSQVLDKNLRPLDCVPGCGRRYYIDDFLNS